MKRVVEVLNHRNGEFKRINVELELPSVCPVCGTAYGEIPLTAFRHEINYHKYGSRNSTAVFFCPHCEYFFYVNYSIYDNGCSSLYKGYMQDTYPILKKRTTFSQELEKLSPQFVSIYKQAELAELQGLSDICGMGYRKALEFLVKDFACMARPDEEADIKSLQLGPCIRKYIDSSRIRTLATASSWLGNDETHYVRQNEDYDLDDLKLFIKSLVTFIESEIAFFEARDLIEKRSSK